MANVSIIGDSHVEALGPLLAQTLSAQGNRPFTLANRGWTTGRYNANPEQLAKVPPTDLFIPILGTNDTANAGYQAQLNSFVNSLRRHSPQAQIIWVGPPTVTAKNLQSRVNNVAEFQKGFLPNQGIRFIDSRPYTTSGQRNDGVHFTADGYRNWATAIANNISGPVSGPPLLAGLGIPKEIAIGLGVVLLLWLASRK